MKLPVRSLLCIFLCLPGNILAAEGLTFSGSYTLAASKGSMKFEKANVKTLSVIQTATSIEVTESEGGRRNVRSYPINGQEGTFVSPGGKGYLQGAVCRYSLIAAVAVTRSVSAIPLKKITEILCFVVRGSAQQRFDVKDFLQCFQCGAVVVANGIAEGLLTAALRKR